MLSIFCSTLLVEYIKDCIPRRRSPRIPSLLGDWMARTVKMEKNRILLCTNEKTAYSLVFDNMKKPDFRDFAPRFTTTLIKQLKTDIGLTEAQEIYILNEYKTLKYHKKTYNGHIKGLMTEFFHIVKYLVKPPEYKVDEGYLASVINKYKSNSKIQENVSVPFCANDLMKALIQQIDE